MRLAEAVTERQLRNIGELYSTAFPAEEQKPFSLLLEKRDEGFVELLSIEDEKETFVGLAIVIVYDDLCSSITLPFCRSAAAWEQAQAP